MNQLIIKLTGTIQNSNFEEWKTELIARIRSVNTELTTDEDFVTASGHVKAFKAAEKDLKAAKQSAIEQASDIQKLFASINEVSEEARQVRLSLERQIRARKLEIKEDYIQYGIDTIHELINRQNDAFQWLDHSAYVDRRRFEAAVKGKAGIKGMQFAIDNLCDEIEFEISHRAAEVSDNLAAIDILPEGYRLLFQDRKALVALSKNELELTIDKRIARFKEENARKKAEKAIDSLKNLEDAELNPERYTGSTGTIKKEKYQLVIDIISTKNMAIEIARSIRETHGGNGFITDIRLTRPHDDD